MAQCDLTKKECVPCSGGVPPLTRELIDELLAELGNGWRVSDGRRLEKTFAFSNFREALTFTNQVGEIAEKQGHHPEIHLGWGHVTLLIWTHKINGLTESDFVLAARAELARCPE
ncbi:MAG: 4a-hydroxytetrahydrobiopterin dehydratase [Lentisphaerae bacterium]|nr:4a-hydroxytetrahydrobiopterin dehydratase [Lentisphaerota bacterium]MBT4819813.1 4a-hydroxytetrahydrobiopterin dehydratase [Lentisphaerota bacterium]MBT5610831.1 4a-hydroxytetrahydrobiopterin dehydratase [Lentisphaerota bacterium]MBT7053737.1 4a-hydroxytetrahydrobiopterin dehydratase [Lentisphaerota bacterium]MBT7841198.1 4a-hydroxytetrahydrobiopterin dehydratase [Lentisphaerota bacterium]